MFSLNATVHTLSLRSVRRAKDVENEGAVPLHSLATTRECTFQKFRGEFLYVSVSCYRIFVCLIINWEIGGNETLVRATKKRATECTISSKLKLQQLTRIYLWWT